MPGPHRGKVPAVNSRNRVDSKALGDGHDGRVDKADGRIFLQFEIAISELPPSGDR